MPARDLPLLTDAVRAAGEVALRYWRRKPRAWDKPDGAGPVTEADLAVNAALEETLRPARPDYGWLSEESPDSAARLAAPAVFVLDPIDGTRAFMAGEEGFAIALAVVAQGRVTAGAVYLPALDRLYAAAEDGAATLNGAPIRASAAAEPEGARVLTTAGNMAESHWPGGVPQLRRAFRPALAWRICLVAEGRFDGTITFRDAWEWDIAAASLIAARAGARVTDAAGAPLRFNAPRPQAPGLIAAPPALHAALMARARG
ncbi:3'(2'),5'-bisphosphate nucleotidase CysQ [Ruixingdingia sedimenti]|uniref:3'(2'),5'-bisphosphate nucleotidase CysQ n=1 Tax=Ruixingdingia sedimenti TaxID=3073604 RepID=A0ABU1F5L2_9RHOB|nr:3'(2'),5'-bisphosphate nucleotidase CysQ [Xinfangfangia sp. LG-4]MDR5652167.1 3'(2'),5'-bisphosphate nucleotidase CysQ [Xinfangfangia sp. LG-4]